LLDGALVLIDEIHTSDCARFVSLSTKDPLDTESPWLDKEYIRQWLLTHPSDGLVLPEEVLAEAKRRYELVYNQLFDRRMMQDAELPLSSQVYHHLVKQKIIKPAYIAIIMGSKEDVTFAKKIGEYLAPYDVFVDMHVVSAHKNGERIADIASTYNDSIEPGCIIAIAGRSNGLGGSLSANVNIPVISCPPFKDQADILLNINSSLFMPSQAPAVTAVYPDQAAAAAIRALNIHGFRTKVSDKIAAMKKQLLSDDHALRQELGLCA